VRRSEAADARGTAAPLPPGTSRTELLDRAARAFLAGDDPDWSVLFGEAQRRRVPLPTYPFEHRRHFVEPGARVATPAAAPGPRAEHPMLDRVVRDDATGRVVAAEYAAAERWFLDENRLPDGSALMPAAAYLEVARAAFEGLGNTGALELRDVYLLAPFVLEGAQRRELRVSLGPDSSEGVEFTVLGADGAGEFQELASGSLRRLAASRPAPVELDGPTELTLPPARRSDVGLLRFHPALLDAAVESSLAGAQPGVFVPVSYGRVVSHALPGERVLAQVRRRDGAGAEFVELDVTICGPAGEVLVEVEQLTLRHLADAGAIKAGRGAPATRPPLDTGPIEQALLRHPAVAETTVVAKHDRPGKTRLVAYFVTGADRRATISELRRHLRGELPAELVPANYLELDKLPRAADGSVDVPSLPDPFAPQDDFVAPRSAAERLVAEVWRELLGIERIGVRDNFFDIGGHSLLAMRAATRIAKRTGARLAPGSLVLQTLEQIAAECERQTSAAAPGR